MKVTHLLVFLPPALGELIVLPRKMTHTLSGSIKALLTPPAVISRQAEQIANARRRAAEGSSRCQRPQLMALPADFPQFREGMAQAAHLLGCTSRIPLEHGFSPVAPRIYDRTDLDLPATASLLFRPLTRYFCSELTIHQLNPSLRPGKLKMTRNWMLLPLSAVE